MHVHVEWLGKEEKGDWNIREIWDEPMKCDVAHNKMVVCYQVNQFNPCKNVKL